MKAVQRPGRTLRRLQGSAKRQGREAGRLLRRLVRRVGLDVVPYRGGPAHEFPFDFDAELGATIRLVRPYTQTSNERLFALCQAVRYLTTHRIPGAFVECGVWRGGSSMAMALTLMQRGDPDRQLYLFDTFEGMPPPTDEDRGVDGVTGATHLAQSDPDDEWSAWCNAPLEGVERAMAKTGYPSANIHMVPGLVEDTIPAAAPDQIALLRLDTDWYQSTRHEMIHLFPRLVPGGVLILDDYGYWEGARRAVDEYLASQSLPILLNRIDATGRIAVIPTLPDTRTARDS